MNHQKVESYLEGWYSAIRELRWRRGSDGVSRHQVLYPVDLATGPRRPVQPMGLRHQSAQQMTRGPHCTAFLRFSNNPKSDFQRGKNG
jgi:hypothetical protein